MFVKIAEKEDRIRELKINESGMVIQMDDDTIKFLPLGKLSQYYQQQKMKNSNLNTRNSLLNDQQPVTIFSPRNYPEYKDLVVTDYDFYQNQVLLYSQNISEAKIIQIDLSSIIYGQS